MCIYNVQYILDYITCEHTCTPYKRAFSIVCLVSGRGGSRKVKRPIFNNKYAFTYNVVQYSSIVLYIYIIYHTLGISNIIRIHLSYTTQYTVIYSI